MHWLIYIAAAFLFVGYALIPKKPLIGWATSAVGNFLYIVAFVPMGKVELLIAPVGFTALSVWNLWKEHKRSSN